MDSNDAAQDRDRDDGRNGFEKFVEAVHRRVSRAPFFLVCLAIVIIWAASAPLWPDLKQWQAAIHTIASVLSLLLLVLLENSGRRADGAHRNSPVLLSEIPHPGLLPRVAVRRCSWGLSFRGVGVALGCSRGVRSRRVWRRGGGRVSRRAGAESLRFRGGGAGSPRFGRRRSSSAVGRGCSASWG